MKIRSTREDFVKEFALPLFLEYLIFALLTIVMNRVAALGPLVQQTAMVGKEMTSPTLGRLVYGAAAFIAFFLFAGGASRAAVRENDIYSFWRGFTAGILLWQAIGDTAWHFSVAGVHFVPMKSIATLPLAILFIVLMIYGKRHHSFDWGIWCMLLSFGVNWIGQYILEGIGPAVAQWVTYSDWSYWASVVIGLLLFLYSIGFFLFRAKTTKGRMLGSMIMFIATVVIYFGLQEG